MSLRFSATVCLVTDKSPCKSFTTPSRFVTASSITVARSPIAALFASILSPWLSKRAFWRTCLLRVSVIREAFFSTAVLSALSLTKVSTFDKSL